MPKSDGFIASKIFCGQMNGKHPDSGQKAREIFDDALNLSPTERDAFIARRCGDDQSLRTSVDALLKSHKEGLLFAKYAKEVRVPNQISQKTGDTIDEYELGEKIGEGGGGVVFKAWQKNLYHRSVALKIIKQPAGLHQTMLRSEAEVKALIALEHRHITRVYYTGTTKDGLPFFTMELVNGKQITDYADKYRLTISERLELFGKVCKAVQFAHEKGFIHQDIKPSNILVYEESEEHVPKVIDFGIAKAIDEYEYAYGFSARAEKIGGTLAYMSPEQAGLGNEEVDAKSDIYSLGVLLYELLAGHSPFDYTGMSRVDAVKMIQETAPELPSNRINTEADRSNFNIAKRRRTNISQLNNTLKGDLDRIVMKCLEKEPKNRYRSVEEVAEDIETHLIPQSNNGTGIFNKPRIRTWIAIVVGLVLLAGLLVWLDQQSRNQVQETPKNAIPSQLPNSQPESQIVLAPDYTTTEGFFRVMTNALDGNSKDISELTNHLTDTGKKVWGWLIEKQWLRNKGTPRIVGRDIECDGKPNMRTLDLIYDYKDGTEHMRIDFFIEKNVLRFHDIYLKQMKLDTFDLYLSDFVNNPHWASIKLGINNPGKVIGAVFGVNK